MQGSPQTPSGAPVVGVGVDVLVGIGVEVGTCVGVEVGTFVTGSGRRRANSFDANPTWAPILHVEF